MKKLPELVLSGSSTKYLRNRILGNFERLCYVQAILKEKCCTQHMYISCSHYVLFLAATFLQLFSSCALKSCLLHMAFNSRTQSEAADPILHIFPIIGDTEARKTLHNHSVTLWLLLGYSIHSHSIRQIKSHNQAKNQWDQKMYYFQKAQGLGGERYLSIKQ